LIGVKIYLIVGGGLAGACAAEALRGQGFDGRIVLVGDELDPPYQRPPLSKEWLLGKVPEEFPLLRTWEFYQKNAIELQLGDRVASSP
jgi:3-phenylpropionate/trans-cinnamate dioxygenase ferredoxin reductase subunit